MSRDVSSLVAVILDNSFDLGHLGWSPCVNICDKIDSPDNILLKSTPILNKRQTWTSISSSFFFLFFTSWSCKSRKDGTTKNNCLDRKKKTTSLSSFKKKKRWEKAKQNSKMLTTWRFGNVAKTLKSEDQLQENIQGESGGGGRCCI